MARRKQEQSSSRTSDAQLYAGRNSNNNHGKGQLKAVASIRQEKAGSACEQLIASPVSARSLLGSFALVTHAAVTS